MGSRSGMRSRMEWRSICQSELYQGRWVALDCVRYDPVSAQPLEGEVVDADEDLADLCARMRASDRTACAILFCEADDVIFPMPSRRSIQPRALQG